MASRTVRPGFYHGNHAIMHGGPPHYRMEVTLFTPDNSIRSALLAAMDEDFFLLLLVAHNRRWALHWQEMAQVQIRMTDVHMEHENRK